MKSTNSHISEATHWLDPRLTTNKEIPSNGGWLILYIIFRLY